MKACFAEQMRDIDKKASELGGIPGIVLMENASISCVKHLDKLKLKNKRRNLRRKNKLKQKKIRMVNLGLTFR